MMDMECSQKSNFKHNGVTAHQGDSERYPENTIPAFKSAIALGVDWIELDIYKTKDNQFVVIHDPETGRIGDRDIQVSRSAYKELKSVDAAHGFRTSRKLTVKECPPVSIPLLSDVIRLVKRQHQTRISIQPKENCVAEAVALIKELQAVQWVGFNDSNLDWMKEVKRHSESIPIFWERPAEANIEDDIQIAKKHGFESIMMHRKKVTKARVDKIHKAGLEAGVSTVFDPARMKMFLAMGVDRIYTNDPLLLMRLIKKEKN